MRKILACSGLVALFVGSVGLSGCARPQPAAAKKGPPEVMVSMPVSKEIEDYEEFAGRLEANASILIRARVTGYLLRHPFKEGGLVKKGQVLFEIDPPLYEAQLAHAKGAVLKAKASFQQAERDWNRAKNLGRESNAISREEYDKFKGVYEVTKADVQVTEADLKMAQVNMDYCKVLAPIGGRISKSILDPGNLVKADDTILTSIGDSDPINVYFDVDERTVNRIVRLMHEGVVPKEVSGVRVRMGLADEEDYPREGVIDFTDNNVDLSTGTLRVRGSFANPDELLVPGMFARVRLPIGKPMQALLIAEKALVTDQGQKFVYVVQDANDAEHEGKVEYRRVNLGRLHDGLRVIKPYEEKLNEEGEVISREGVKPNEKVVVSGLQRIRPDIQVKFKDVEMPRSTPSGSIDPAKPKSPSPKNRDGSKTKSHK